MFNCGGRHFTHQHKDETKTSKNPYAHRGLDKFSTLLADLNHKRQKIYAQMGSDDISFVRFVYSGDSKQAKPIVVKVKSKNKNSLGHSETEKTFDETPENREMVVKQEMQKKFGRLGYCLVAIAVVIFVIMLIYGRLLAIFWATMGWYLVPAMVGRSRRGRKKRKRKVSERPASSESRASGWRDGTITPQQYGHGRRW